MTSYRPFTLIISCLAGAGLLLSVGAILSGVIEPASQNARTLMIIAFVCGVVCFGRVLRDHAVLIKGQVNQQKEREERAERGNGLKAIFDNAPVEMYLKDTEGRYVQINRRFEELFGVTNEDLAGKLPSYAHDPELGERTREHDLAVLDTGEVVIREEHAVTEFGPRVLHTIKFPIFDDHDRIRGVGAIVSDITDMKNVENAFRESIQRLDAILQNTPIAIHLKDMDGRYLVINQAFETLFDCSRDDVLGHTFEENRDSIPVSDGQDMIAEVEREVIRSGEPRRFEIEQTIRGEVRHIELLKFPVLDEKGVVLGIGGIESDITERKRAEDAIKLSEERFRDFSAAGSDWYWELDENLCYTLLTAGRGLEAVYPVEQFIGQHRTAVKPEGVNEQAWEEHVNDLEAHRPFRDFVQPRKLSDGRTIWLSVSGVMVTDENGDFRGYRGTVVDITERQHAEKRIKESEARLQALFDNASEGMFFRDIDGRYEMVNITFANRLGFDDVSQIVGKTVFDLYPREDAELYRLDDIACMGNREISSTEVEIPLPNGTELVQFAIKFPIVSADGFVIGIGGIDIDITERKNLERMKNEFISTVSHELRTPLTSIKGSLGLVVDGALGVLPSEANNMVDVAYRNTNRLISLVNDVLDMEKIASGAMNYDFQRLDVSILVKEALDAARGYMTEYGDRQIVTDIEEGVFVNGDAKRLDQVIANLLSNAIKFSHAGGEVKVVVSRRNDEVLVSIIDHGDGIPESFHGRLFERFSQADSSDTREKGGTGLGLNISKSIIEMHGGVIDFESQVGQGSTFYFRMPLAE